MRSILPRYPNKSITLGELTASDISSPTFKKELGAAVTIPETKKDETFWTTPFGATLGLGIVFGGLYYLAKNMGVASK